MQYQLHAICFFLIASGGGCIAIRDGTEPIPMITIRETGAPPALSQECCTLYDRGDVAKQWANKLNPIHLIPQRVTDFAGNCKQSSANWVSNQHGKCLLAKESVHCWAKKKKEEANAPPWPRFHPIPTKPVFEHKTSFNENPPDESGPPQVYGRFGKE